MDGTLFQGVFKMRFRVIVSVELYIEADSEKEALSEALYNWQDSEAIEFDCEVDE